MGRKETALYGLGTLKIYSTIGAILGWFAVFLQLYLIIINRTHPVPETIVRFFSYFTILTNIIVAICFTAIAFKRFDDKQNFFAKPATLAATTVYIIIVGVVYNLVLRFLWEPKGLQRLADELLHSLMPVLFIIAWLVFIPKDELKWRHALNWLIYPVAYIIYTLVHGALSGFYPYPFIDVTQIGYSKALLNGFLLFLTFFFLSLAIIALGKFISKKAATTSSTR